MRRSRKGARLQFKDLARLLDNRTPEQRRVALVRYDRDFAEWQRMNNRSPWDRLREAIR